jgi:hypothetical protein
MVIILSFVISLANSCIVDMTASNPLYDCLTSPGKADYVPTLMKTSMQVSSLYSIRFSPVPEWLATSFGPQLLWRHGRIRVPDGATVSLWHSLLSGIDSVSLRAFESIPDRNLLTLLVLSGVLHVSPATPDSIEHSCPFSWSPSPPVILNSGNAACLGIPSTTFGGCWVGGDLASVHRLGGFEAFIADSQIIRYLQKVEVAASSSALLGYLARYFIHLEGLRAVKRDVADACGTASSASLNSSPSMRSGVAISPARLLKVLSDVFVTALDALSTDQGESFYWRSYPTAGGLASVIPIVFFRDSQGVAWIFSNAESQFVSVNFPSDASAPFAECSLNWGGVAGPPAIVVFAVEFPRLVWRYHGLAYDLAHMDVGFCLARLHAALDGHGLQGCMAANLQLLSLFSRLPLPQQPLLPLAGYGVFGRA